MHKSEYHSSNDNYANTAGDFYDSVQHWIPNYNLKKSRISGLWFY